MKIRYIPAGITLIAGAITCLICLMRNLDVMYSLEILLIVLVIFLFIGIKAQKIIVNILHEQKMEEEDEIRRNEFREAEKLRRIQTGVEEDPGDEKEEETEIEE